MFGFASTEEMSQAKKEMKNEAKSKTEKIEHKYWFMKESNRIVSEIWMFKIDKPSGRADLHNQPLLDLADTETKYDTGVLPGWIVLQQSLWYTELGTNKCSSSLQWVCFCY